MARNMIIPIAPSGSGKSTLLERMQKEDPELISWGYSQFREGRYKTYTDSIDTKKFFEQAHADFKDLILSLEKYTNINIFIDNMNLTRISRSPFVRAAHKHGFNLHAYIFLVPYPILCERQIEREKQGKERVDNHTVAKQLQSLEYPRPSEKFDTVYTIVQEIKKCSACGQERLTESCSVFYSRDSKRAASGMK